MCNCCVCCLSEVTREARAKSSSKTCDTPPVSHTHTPTAPVACCVVCLCVCVFVLLDSWPSARDCVSRLSPRSFLSVSVFFVFHCLHSVCAPFFLAAGQSGTAGLCSCFAFIGVAAAATRCFHTSPYLSYHTVCVFGVGASVSPTCTVAFLEKARGRRKFFLPHSSTALPPRTLPLSSRDSFSLCLPCARVSVRARMCVRCCMPVGLQQHTRPKQRHTHTLRRSRISSPGKTATAVLLRLFFHFFGESQSLSCPVVYPQR